MQWREESDSTDSWSFKIDDRGHWTWEHKSLEGQVILASSRSSKTLEECQQDAKTRGYRG